MPYSLARATLPARIGRLGHLWKTQDPFRLFLFFLTLVTISRIHRHFGLGPFRPALVMAFGAMVYAILNPRVVNWNDMLRYWPARLVAGLAMLACLSAAFGISLGASATFILEEYSKVIIFTFLLIVAIRTTADLRLFVAAYVISAAVLVYFALFVFNLGSTSTGMMRLNNLYTYDANDIGLVLLVAVPLSLWLLETARGKWRLLIMLLILGIGASIARTGSRGAFVGAVATVLALLWFVRHVGLGRRLVVLFALAATLVFTAPPGYWEQMETVTRLQEDYNWTEENGRRQIALRGLGYMSDYPLFGLGIGNFRRAEGMISEKATRFGRAGRGIRWTPSHNSYVQVGAELGVPGLVLWCSLILGGVVAMVRLRRRLPSDWAHGDLEQRFLYSAPAYMSVALIAFAVPAIFLSFAYRDPIYVLSAFLCGVYVSVDRRLREERRGNSRSVRQGGLRRAKADARRSLGAGPT